MRITLGRHGQVVVRIVHRMIALSGYDRALALASQGFVALVPMVVVLASVLQGQGGAASVAEELGLPQGLVAATTDLLGGQAPDAELTALGACLLVVSVFGFIRTLQRTYAAAWDMPPSRLGDVGRGLLASVALVVEFAVLVLVAPVLSWLFDSLVVGVAGHAMTALLLWWPIQRVLLSGRVGWMRLLPGALVAGVGQSVLVALSGFYVPVAVARAAERLGLLGVATVVLSWLVVLGLLLVFSAVAGAEIARGSTSSDADEVVAPRPAERLAGPGEER